MMDAYSFDESYENSMLTYSKVFGAYVRIFKRMGFTSLAVSADSGAIGGSISHEFHILASTGESTIYYDSKALELAQSSDYCIEKLNSVYAATDEAHDSHNKSVSCLDLHTTKSIEVGHIFYLDDRYSRPMNLGFINSDGRSSSNVKMGI